jgi:hypothetical protein
MQNRLSLADLKAKANVIANTEVYTGGDSICHIKLPDMSPPRDGVVIQNMVPR